MEYISLTRYLMYENDKSKILEAIYILDKEMGDVEVLYRDQRDYQSKYRTVVEYFAMLLFIFATANNISLLEFSGSGTYNPTAPTV